MGLALAKLAALISKLGTTDARIVMLGLDAAGKSTLLYKLKLGEVTAQIPTIGFNVETLEYKKFSITMWDVGGQTILRPLWRHYYAGSQALIYVVDSSDVDRVELAAEELRAVLDTDEMKDCAVLVYANKQDMRGALSPTELAARMGLHSLRGHKWYIQAACAKTGDGLYEGLDWVVGNLTPKA